MSPFDFIGNVPFDLSVLSSIFPKNKQISDKARMLENAGRIIRLKKGLYVASQNETGKTLYRELIANHIYGPSYVSQETALRYYGLIPERVYLVKSVTTKHSRNFENFTGNYHYQNCSKEYFPIGVKIEENNSINFLIATPEKALCDLINFGKSLNFRSLKDVSIFLNDDIRLDMDRIDNLNISIIEKCAEYSRKQKSINLLTKFMKHERNL